LPPPDAEIEDGLRWSEVIMRITHRMGLAVGVMLIVIGVTRPLEAQDLLSESLSWFPPQTIALEYSNPSTLRNLPNYESLRAHYLGRNLKTLEASLTKLGIHESDIDEMTLGWEAASGQTMQYEGLATGRFDVASTDRHAASAGIVGHPVEGFKAYCLPSDPNSSCIIILDSSLGMFGPLPILQGMLRARQGQGLTIGSNVQFTDLVHSAQSDAPIWGVALGQAVAKWFKAWMPGEKNFQMDWSTAFKDVNALSYRIEAGDNVQLHVKLNCTSEQGASSVRQLLEGLKLIQQLAWHTMNPNQPNPFQNIEVEAANRQVSLNMTADYAALEHVGPLGKP
jgi:hypothetical protein